MEHVYYCTPDFEIKEFRNRPVTDEIEMVIKAFDCVVPDNKGVYCSSDVTTGKGLYRLLRQYGAHSRAELKEMLGEGPYAQVMDDLIRKNIERGCRFTETLRQRGVENLINPGPFIGPGFEQEHYHYLWERVILKKVYEMWLNEGWEYSNGCTLEYAIAVRKGIPRLEHSGNVIELKEATERVAAAVAELQGYGIYDDNLAQNLARIKELAS